LDPALLRSGRLDRKIEFPHPTEDARAKIIRIHRWGVGGLFFLVALRGCLHCVGGDSEGWVGIQRELGLERSAEP